MKKILILFMFVFLSVALCSCIGKTESSSIDVVKLSVISTSQQSSTDVSESYQYESYIDEENQLMFNYTDIFDLERDPDQNGMVTFTSTKDNAVMRYWVIPNTYSETPEEFLDYASLVKGEELENNVVIGMGEGMDMETGEGTFFASYWSVDPTFIACVEISCETYDEAEKWYSMLNSSAVFLESTSSSDTSKMDEDTAFNLLSNEISGMLVDNTATVSLGNDVVNGEDCWMFATGKNTLEKFTAEEHFAVMQDGSIYVLDIYGSNEYIPYTPLYFSDPPID